MRSLSPMTMRLGVMQNYMPNTAVWWWKIWEVLRLLVMTAFLIWALGGYGLAIGALDMAWFILVIQADKSPATGH